MQASAIPVALTGKDLIAIAKTGSGKTAACAIPVCQRVRMGGVGIQALILVPTRELAVQYAIETQKIGKRKGVKVFAIYGGEDASLQQSKLRHGVHVLVATPGRLIDFIYSRQIDLTHVETLVLDEADEMLNMGFYDDVEFIINCLVHEHQTLLFSATMPDRIRQLAKNHLRQPVELTHKEAHTTPKAIDHRFVACGHADRPHTLEKALLELKPKHSIIFCRSRIQCEEVCRALRKRFPAVEYLHAGLSQDMRSSITDRFRRGKVSLLVATDVASRGLDFTSVTHVFIYQLSEDPDQHVHRAGRTGRFERSGMVVSLVTPRDRHLLEKVVKKLAQEPIWIGEPLGAEPQGHKGHKAPRGHKGRRGPKSV